MPSLIQFHHEPFTEFDRLFEEAFNTRFYNCAAPISQREGGELAAFRPRLDLYESEDASTVTATFELPGLSSNDVTIDVHQDRLTVSGESTSSDAHKDEGYAMRERRYGKFSRTLQLPVGTKPEDIQAKMENGILTVTFPKTTPEQQPKRIAVL